MEIAESLVQLEKNSRYDGVDNDAIESVFFENIEKYRLLDKTDTLLCLFSGGKDATFGLELMIKYQKMKRIKINLQALMITYPTHVYFSSDNEPHEVFSNTIAYWKRKDVNLNIVRPSHQDIADRQLSSCKECKQIRMNALNLFYEEAICAYPQS